MQAKSEGNRIMVKAEYGEDVKDVINSVLDKFHISSGEITWGLGKIRDLEIGYHDGKDYLRRVFRDGLEIVSFHGSIASVEPRLHIHCAGAGPDHALVGGHFFGGIAEPLLEMSITKFDEINIVREKSQKSGLMEARLI